MYRRCLTCVISCKMNLHFPDDEVGRNSCLTFRNLNWVHHIAQSKNIPVHKHKHNTEPLNINDFIKTLQTFGTDKLHLLSQVWANWTMSILTISQSINAANSSQWANTSKPFAECVSTPIMATAHIHQHCFSAQIWHSYSHQNDVSAFTLLPDDAWNSYKYR